jgi:hypothetical protein
VEPSNVLLALLPYASGHTGDTGDTGLAAGLCHGNSFLLAERPAEWSRSRIFVPRPQVAIALVESQRRGLDSRRPRRIPETRALATPLDVVVFGPSLEGNIASKIKWA